MFIPLTIAMILGTPGEDPKSEPPAQKKELFAAEDFYRSMNARETTFEGVLRYKPRGADVVGFGRFNPFTLVMKDRDGKESVREVYVGGKDSLLKPYADRTVRFVGKPVEMEVEGTLHREIWPARVELVSATK